MTSQTTVKTLLILGASGDLTGRLLLPGLARLVAAGRAAGLSLVGAGSDPWTPEQWRERVQSSFAAAAGAADEPGKEALDLLQKETVYHQVDVTAKGALAALLKTLEGPVAVYFALPPRISQLACETLQPGEV
ncbi:MAG TPA: glucose-6-phosphate dehydrogenase, partial [Arthrobacter sp.]